jgi:hypothetical protein
MTHLATETKPAYLKQFIADEAPNPQENAIVEF